MPRFRYFATNHSSLAQDVNAGDVVGAILSSCGPSLLSRSLIGQVGKQSQTASVVSVAFACFKVKFAQIARKNRVLATENVELKQELATVRSDMVFLQDELQVFRDRSYGLMESERKHALSSKEDQELIKSLESKVAQYGEFIRTLVDLKLDNPVKRAALAVMNDEDFEDALVSSVQAASQNKNSAWSRIIPAVTGPRSPENYISVLNLTLRTRKELRERNKVSDFWKSKAKMTSENHDLITPSASTLSDLCEEISHPVLSDIQSPNPPPVLENMLDTLKRGRSWPPSHESTNGSEFQSMHPLLLDNLEKDLISESASILSDEIRHSLKLRVARAEEVVGPLGILKNGSTSTNASGKCKDGASGRIVRFTPSQENAIILRPASIDSTCSSLSYVSEVADNRVQGTHDNIASTASTSLAPYMTETEFSGSESVLSDVYADFLNETEGGEASVPRDHNSLDVVQTPIFSYTAELATRNTLEDDLESASSGSEYSDMCEMEDFEPSAPLEEKATHIDVIDGCKDYSITAPSAHPDVATYQSLIDKAGHKRLPSIEEEEEIPPPLSPDTTVPPQSFVVAESSPEQGLSKPVNKRYGRVVLSPTPLSPTDLPSPRASPSSLLPLRKSEKENEHPPSLSHAHVPLTRIPQNKPADLPKRNAPLSTVSELPATPPRSRLSVPQSFAGKRPALQDVKTNASTASSVTRARVVSEDQKSTGRPSAKELGKRRGVIMVEKKNIMSAVPNSPVLTQPKRLSSDRFGVKPASSSHVRQSSTSSQRSEQGKENASDSRAFGGSRKPTVSPTTATLSSRAPPRAPLVPPKSGQSSRKTSPKASPDLSRFDSDVADLLDSMSSSDLGSLEPSDAEESESELDLDLIRAVQRRQQASVRSLPDLPRIQKALQREADAISSRTEPKSSNEEAAEPRASSRTEDPIPVRAGFARRPPLSTRSFMKSRDNTGGVVSSDSTSSCNSSSTSSLYAESPTRSGASFTGSRFGFARTSGQPSKPSPMLSKAPQPVSIPSPSARLRQPEAGSSESKSSSPSLLRVPVAAVASKQNREAIKTPPKLSSPLRPSAIPKASALSIQSKAEHSRAAAVPVVPVPAPPPDSLISRPGQGILSKIPNASAKSKLAVPSHSISQQSTPSSHTTSQLLAPPTPSNNKPRSNNINTILSPSTPQQSTSSHTASKLLAPPTPSSIKPRSNTINSISPLPPRYHTPMNLSPNSPTKPRSNTVNSYSPHGRSPLSQSVVASSSPEFQSRLTHAPSSIPKVNNTEPEAPQHSARPYGTKIHQAMAAIKSTAPLQIVKKNHPVAGKARETRPSPSMRLAGSPASTNARGLPTAITPLIPNWGDGGLSASQYRSMLHSNAMMALR